MSRVSFNNPFNWIANKLSPAITEKKDEASHVIARQKRAKEGMGNLFDAAAVAAETEKPTSVSSVASVVPRKKHTEVHIHSAFP